MQTFLPYRSFARSARCLDNKRLGKQRVEAVQILDALCRRDGARRGWAHHPAVLQWNGYEAALYSYLQDVQAEWLRRGFNGDGIAGHMKRLCDSCHKLQTTMGKMPPWLGQRAFHASHKSNLLRKDPAWYGRYGWGVPPDRPYVWPVRRSETKESMS